MSILRCPRSLSGKVAAPWCSLAQSWGDSSRESGGGAGTRCASLGAQELRQNSPGLLEVGRVHLTVGALEHRPRRGHQWRLQGGQGMRERRLLARWP